MGVIVSYLAAVVFGKFGWCDAIDYTNVANAAWIGLPLKWENTVFPLFSSPDWGRIVSAVAIVFPLAFATIMEHVGDVSAISSTVKRNFFENPGLHRTMLGDGLATCLASLFGAPANTTYGENTGVLSLSKVYDPRVIRIAACLAILVSFCPKFSAFIGTIPGATIGGVSFILYGMISAVGVRNLVESQVDLGKSRNMLIAALILVLTLGISFSKAGAIAFTVGSLKISLSGLAVGALLGIVLNAILPGKDFAFSGADDVQIIAANAAANCDALYIPTDNTAATYAEAIHGAVADKKLPIIAGEEGICSACGIATLSIDYYDLGYATGEMAVKILRGEANVSEMAIEYTPADKIKKKYNKAICEDLGIDTAALEAKGFTAIQ